MASGGGSGSPTGIEVQLGSVTPGATVEIRRATDSGFATAVTIYSGPNPSTYQDLLPNDGKGRWYDARQKPPGKDWSSPSPPYTPAGNNPKKPVTLLA